MGGGDLNNKKSWHPNTMKNQERVWKAEQALASERKRIEDLQKEISSERSREELKSLGQNSGVLDRDHSSKLDWMYKQPDKDINTEEYLLGKAVDKNFESAIAKQKHESKNPLGPPKNHVEHECIPFSIRNFRGLNEIPTKEAQVDMARKIQEDPLMAIRKREMESRAQLLQNPVKLKELTRLLKEDKVKQKDKKQKKKDKKSTKDLDYLLAKKLKKLQSSEKLIDIDSLLHKNKHKSKSQSKKYHDIDTNSDSEYAEQKSFTKEKHQRELKRKDNTTSSRHSGHDNGSMSDDSEYSKNKSKAHKKKSKKDARAEKELISNKDKLKNKKELKRNISSDEEIMYYKNKQETSAIRHSENLSRDRNNFAIHESRTQKRTTQNKEDNTFTQKSNKKPKLTEKEMEEKRKEMIRNASERDLQRSKNVAKYREEERKEEEKINKSKFDENFVDKQLRRTAGVSSVESRIKANINNIQRSRKDMDVNFARR